MEDWKERLIEEKNQLTDRINKLQQFVLTDKFDSLPYTDKELLMQQLEAMDNYAYILTQRVDRTFIN